MAAALPFITAAVSIAGTIAGVAGQAQESHAQADTSRAQADIAEQQALREQQNAEADARNFRRRQNALLATARARRAGSGVKVDSGTSLLTDQDFVKEIALGEATIRNQGEVSSTRLEQQAQLYRRQARGIEAGIPMASFGTLLSGFSSTPY
jgi:hypothetical protein